MPVPSDEGYKPENIISITNYCFINIHIKMYLVIINQKIICYWVGISTIYSLILLKEVYSVQNDIFQWVSDLLALLSSLS